MKSVGGILAALAYIEKALISERGGLDPFEPGDLAAIAKYQQAAKELKDYLAART